jgi:hypothetical protein
MAQVFRDSCGEVYRRRGGIGIVSRWLETVLALVVSVVDEHSQENFLMARTTLIRGLALAGLVGGALWVAAGVIGVLSGAGRSLAGFDDLRTLFALGLGFGAAGLFGLYLHATGQWPARARLVLLAAAGLGVWAFVVSFFVTSLWVMLAGLLAQAACLGLIGPMLWSQPLARHWVAACLLQAMAMAAFSIPGWQAFAGAAAGIFAVLLSAQLLGESLNPRREPPLAQ